MAIAISAAGVARPVDAVITDAETGALVRAFFNLAARWRLTDRQGRILLGGSAARTYARWKAGQVEPSRISRDTRERLSMLMGIHKNLRILFPNRRAATGGFARRTGRSVAIRRSTGCWPDPSWIWRLSAPTSTRNSTDGTGGLPDERLHIGDASSSSIHGRPSRRIRIHDSAAESTSDRTPAHRLRWRLWSLLQSRGRITHCPGIGGLPFDRRTACVPVQRVLAESVSRDGPRNPLYAARETASTECLGSCAT